MAEFPPSRTINVCKAASWMLEIKLKENGDLHRANTQTLQTGVHPRDGQGFSGIAGDMAVRYDHASCQ